MKSFNRRLLSRSSLLTRLLFRNLNQLPNVSVGSSAKLTKCFTGQDVETFARISLDDNALHLDSNHAKKTGFQDRIVHGILVNG